MHTTATETTQKAGFVVRSAEAPRIERPTTGHPELDRERDRQLTQAVIEILEATDFSNNAWDRG